jgi:hypothetical protein
MNFKLIVLFLFSIINLNSFAQINGIIRGNVKDKNTQETIVGAVISSAWLHYWHGY